VTELLILADSVAQVVVSPTLGAGLRRYDFIAGGRREPLFRPAPEGATAPFELANILLVPWSNRISGGGFYFNGEFHPLAPNAQNEPFPIHGNGFTSSWSISERGPHRAVLTLVSEGPGPFRYDAKASYELNDGALTIALSVTNRAETPLPFGLGFHPWLPRDESLLIEAAARGVWLEDSRHLPAGFIPAGARPEWDFAASRALPEGWINNAFAGWNGRARLVWPDRRLALDVAASPELSHYVLYSPSAAADFFCFEPVSHPVDAHNLDGGPTANGLAILVPGSEFSVSCRFAPRLL
jgi:aldose 1-epimerase